MDNKPMKLFAIKQSKGCKLIRKMQQNTFGGRAVPRPAGGEQTHGRNGGGLLLKGEKEGEGAYF